MRVRVVSFGGGSYRGDGRPLFRFPGGSPRILRRGGFETASAGGMFRGEATFTKLLSALNGLLEALEAGS